MPNTSSSRTLVLAGTAALAALCLSPTIAAAHPLKAKDLQAISGRSPFSAGCGVALDDTLITGYEFEPTVAVNPANPRNIIAAWQQDRGKAARSNLVAPSLDGGKNWTHVQVPGISKCTGGEQDADSDAWLTIGPDGTAYLASLPGVLTEAGAAVEFLVNRSTDGGLSWSPPVVVAPADPRNDKEAIVADPNTPGTVYATWGSRDPDYSPFALNSLIFSRTTDASLTWSPPLKIDEPPPGETDQASVPLVLPDGRLLVIFSRVNSAGAE